MSPPDTQGCTWLRRGADRPLLGHLRAEHVSAITRHAAHARTVRGSYAGHENDDEKKYDPVPSA